METDRDSGRQRSRDPVREVKKRWGNLEKAETEIAGGSDGDKENGETEVERWSQ